ncbi:MerR family DNA-binding transcriptional regulator, partial [Patescibacteria group bacterium]|nr:MerR family DNA-binding transcriptional regulator [Patescibacteria group bacterium]
MPSSAEKKPNISSLEKTQLSVSEAAAYLKVSPSTLRRLESEGEIKAIRQPNGYRLFELNDLLNLKKSLEIKKNEKKIQKQIEKKTVKRVHQIQKNQREVKVSNQYVVNNVIYGQPNPNVFYSISKASKYLGISPSTLRRKEKYGEINSYRKSNRHRVFNLNDLKKLKVKLTEEKKYKDDHTLEKKEIATQTRIQKQKAIHEKIEEFEEKLNQIAQFKPSQLPSTRVKGPAGTSHVVVRKYSSQKGLIHDRIEKRKLNYGILLGLAWLVTTLGVATTTIILSKKDLNILAKRNTYNTYMLQGGNVLGLADKLQTYIFRINVASVMEKSLAIKDTLEVEHLSTLKGGITTLGSYVETGTLNFTDTGDMNNLLAIDDTTETTLEEALDIRGDVIGDSLLDVKIAEDIVDDGHLVNTLTYTGDWDFGGTWGIDGATVEATADEINLLSGLSATTEELNTLSGVTIEDGGIVYSDGSTFLTDATNLTWDSSSYRLGIGTNAPNYALEVNGYTGISSGYDLLIGGIGLSDVGTSSTTSGASLISAFDEFTSTDQTNLQDILREFDANIGIAGIRYWELYGNTVSTILPTYDMSVGGSEPGSSLYFDADAELLTLTNTTSGVSFIVNDQANDTTPFAIDNAGNIGIGTSAPNYKLTVDGTVAIRETGASPHYYTILQADDQPNNITYTLPENYPADFNFVLAGDPTGDLRWASVSGVGSITGSGWPSYITKWSSGSTLGISVMYETEGKIGIATTAPDYMLDIAGTLNMTNLYIDDNEVISTAAEINYLDGSSITTGGVVFANGTNFTQDVTNLFWDNTNNYLGIATSTPNAALTVGNNEQFTVDSSGNVNTTAGVLWDLSSVIHSGSEPQGFKLPQGNGLTSMTIAAGEGYIAWDSSDKKLKAFDGTGWFDVAYGAKVLWTDAGPHVYADNFPQFVISDLHRIGIGTSTPSYLLDVAGTMNTNTLLIAGSTITSSASEINFLDGATVISGGLDFGNGTFITQDAENLFWDDSGDRLGIGNSNPQYTLDITGNIRISNFSGSDTNEIVISDSGELGTRTVDSRVWGTTLLDGSGPANYIARFLDSNTIGIGILYDSGNAVGIGNTAPAHMLDVAGTMASQGLVLAGTAVTSSANEINILTGATVSTAEINYLTGSSVLTGGIVFGNGANFAQDVTNIFWDNTNNYLGIATSTPTAALTVGNNEEFTVDSSGNVTSADGTLWDLSDIAHNDSAVQGFKLPQGNGLTSLVPAAGEGYIAWDLNDQKLKAFDGTGWFDVAYGARVLWTDAGPHVYADNFPQFVISDLHRIGIGTSTPSYLLDVAGTAAVQSLILNGGTITSSASEINILDGATVTYNELNFLDGASVTNGGLVFGNGTYLTQDAANIFWQDTNNRLGIGTSSPNYTLSINGTLGFIEVGTEPTPQFYTIFQGGDQNQNITYTWPVDYAGGNNYVLSSDTSGTLEWLDLAAAGSVIGSGTPNYVMKWLTTQNATISQLYDDGTFVGIGTSAPSYLLDVSGTLNTLNLFLAGSEVSTTAAELNILDGATVTTAEVNYLSGSSVLNGGVVFGNGTRFTQDIANFYWNDATNRLGIGNTSPSATFSVGSASQFAVDNLGNILLDANMTISNSRLVDLSGIIHADTAPQGLKLPQTGSLTNMDNALAGEGYIAWDNTIDKLMAFDGTTWFDVAYGATVLWSDAGPHIYADNYGLFAITDSGRVGIGTSTPSFNLDVAGTVNTTNLYIADTAVTSSANELNFLDGTSVISGGITFGNGTYITQDVSNLFWDNSNNRLGVGTSSPGYEVTINGSLGFIEVGTEPVPQFYTIFQGGDQYRNITYTWPTDYAGGDDFLLVSNASGTMRWMDLSQTDTIFGSGITNFIPKFSDTDTITVSQLYDDGTYVGIGDSNPAHLLDVGGTTATIGFILSNVAITADGNEINILDGVTANAGEINYLDGASVLIGGITFGNGTYITQDVSELYWDASNDRLGLGITNPSYTLDITGNMRLTTFSGVDSNSVVIENSGVIGNRTIDSRVWGTTLLDGSGPANYIARFLDLNTLGTGLIYDNNTYVGINDLTPSYMLDVGGTISGQALVLAGTAISATAAELNILDGATLSTTELNYLTNSSVINGGVVFGNGTNFTQNVSSFFWDNTNILLGIGTSNPGYNLDVAGTINTTNLYMANIEVTSTATELNYLDGSTVYSGGITYGNSTNLTQDLADFYWNSSSNRLGLGTSAPGQTLTIYGDFGFIETGTDPVPQFYTIFQGGDQNQNITYTWPTDYAGDINYVLLSDPTGKLEWTSLLAAGSVIGSGTNNYVTKWTTYGNIGDASLYDDGTYVGIGTSVPSYTLDVVGDVRISSGNDYYIGTIGLGSTGPTQTTSGAYLIGVYDQFNSSDAEDLQETLYDFDQAIGAGASKWTQTGGLTFLTIAANDLAVGGSHPSSVPFYIDVSEDTVWIDQNTLFVDGNNDRVGIGTTIPQATFSVGANSPFRVDSSGDITRLKNVSYSWPNVAADNNDYVLASDTSGNLTWKSVSGVGSITGQGEVNYLARFDTRFTLTYSTVFDDGVFVGVGTSTPSFLLDVAGTLNTTNLYIAGSAVTADASEINLLDGATVTTTEINYLAGSAVTVGGLVFADGSNFTQDAVNLSWDDSNNRLGIGTSTPLYTLDVNGDARIATFTGTDTNSVVIEDSGVLGNRTINSRVWGNTLLDGSGPANYVARFTDLDTLGPGLIYDNNTYVGINDPTPSYMLDVGGTISGQALVLTGTAITASGSEINILDGATVTYNELNYLDNSSVISGGIVFGNGTNLTQDTGFLFWDNSNNRLGVGNSAPTQTLSVGPSSQFTVDSYGNVSVADNALVDLSG